MLFSLKIFMNLKMLPGESTKKFSSIKSILENKKYIIVTHPEDIFKQYSDQLSNSPNPPLMIMTDVQPNPDYLDILTLLNKFSSIAQEVDHILAIGGGSVIDTAKALAAFKGDQTLLTNFIRNNQKPHVVDPISIIAVPSTSGTSSELTCWATIWDKEKKKKFSLAHPLLYPIKAIIDPHIMLNKPRGLTISTGLDALSHSMESIWNINANPISATHGIIGSLVAVGLISRGPGSIGVQSLVSTVVAWVVSPLVGAIVAGVFHFVIHIMF